MRRTFGALGQFCLSIAWVLSVPVWAESQINDYPGVKDPFGDPSNYEFSEDEQADKEFFHLGRFLMFGVDVGAGIFTGGLGSTSAPAVMFGGRFLFFMDRSLALEASAHYAYHLDLVRAAGGGGTGIDYDVDFIPINFGLRFYFDTRGAPRALSIANPYLAAGGGVYMRTLTPASASPGVTAPLEDSTSFGAYGGAGVEFLIYGTHIYMGADIRYHMIFFPDESTTLNGLVAQGDRAGDYLTTLVTLTYNF
jgi:outer membrane protein W